LVSGERENWGKINLWPIDDELWSWFHQSCENTRHSREVPL